MNMMPVNGPTFIWRVFAIVLCLLASSFTASASLPKANSLFGQQNASPFLPVNDAFIFNFSQSDEELTLEWEIAEGYYLYQDKIAVSATDAKLGELVLPAGHAYQDEFFGEVTIYRDQLDLFLPIYSANNNASVTVSYQGCAEAGFCYPPETITLPLSAVSDTNLATETRASTEPATQSGVTSLAENWWQPLLFLLLGIGLAFTPCVLPMYPILTGIVLGGGKRSHGQTFRLAMLYVQGMALTYTLLGLVVASAGLQFQAALQHPYVLIAISALFIVLAASMFGAFSLQLPASLQTRLAQLSNQQQGGNSLGVFIMGAISGLVCSPCTTAPLSGALLYVAQSGDLLTGAVTLYALAIGMGIPLIIAAMFGNKLLPRAGEWMQSVKILFGFILLAAPLFLVSRLLPEQISAGLVVLWLVVFSGWLYHQSRAIKQSLLASILAIAAIIGLSAATYQGYQLVYPPTASQNSHNLAFIRINNVSMLEQELAKAKQAGKPVMLDFYADWCVACKEFEKYTFSQPSVQNQLADFVFLQADVTKNTPEDIELLSRMQVLGLPTIDFWNAKGEFIANARVSGFLKAAPFARHVETQVLMN